MRGVIKKLCEDGSTISSQTRPASSEEVKHLYNDHTT
jgi:hypothetical protein